MTKTMSLLHQKNSRELARNPSEYEGGPELG